MLKRRLFVIAGCLLAVLPIAACGQVEGGTAGGAQAPTITAPPNVQSSDGSMASGPTPAEPSDEPQQAGGTSAGPGSDDTAVASAPDAALPAIGPMTTYADPTYGFHIEHPAGFEVRSRPAEGLAALVPPPVAGLGVLSPARAASDLGDLEAPDLEIRVYPAAGIATIEEWLAANGMLPENAPPPQTFQTATVSGLELCGTTMIAPGCAYFFLGEGWLYQLVPASLEGQSVLETFGFAAR